MENLLNCSKRRGSLWRPTNFRNVIQRSCLETHTVHLQISYRFLSEGKNYVSSSCIRACDSMSAFYFGAIEDGEIEASVMTYALSKLHTVNLNVLVFLECIRVAWSSLSPSVPPLFSVFYIIYHFMFYGSAFARLCYTPLPSRQMLTLWTWPTPQQHPFRVWHAVLLHRLPYFSISCQRSHRHSHAGTYG